MARDLAAAYAEDPEGLRELIKDWRHSRSNVLPEAGSSAPERRAGRVADLAVDAPGRQYQQRTRSVRVLAPGFRDDSKQYLRGLYTNDDGVMMCQICLAEMPFKIRGEYYFEAVQYVRLTQRDLVENALALCPTCSAKYRKALGTSFRDLRMDLMTQEIGASTSVKVAVTLAEQDADIRFVGSHAIDLQAALEVTEADETDEVSVDSDGPDR